MTSTALLENDVASSALELGTSYSYPLSADEAAVRRMRHFAKQTGLSFYCVHADSGAVLAATDENLVTLLPRPVALQLPDVCGPQVWKLATGFVFYALPLPAIDGLPTVAVGYVLNHTGKLSEALQVLGEEHSWSPDQLAAWVTAQQQASPELLEQMLEMFWNAEANQSKLSHEVELQAQVIERDQSEIRFISGLASELVLSTSTTELATSCASGLLHLTAAAGCLVAIQDRHGRWSEYSAGQVPLSGKRFELLADYFEGTIRFDAVIRNQVEGTLIGEEFPVLRNFVLLPITDGNRQAGWIFMGNLSDEQDFGEFETRLGETAAALLAAHYCNRQLYDEHEEYMLQFVGSLVSTLDAKDPYTRGHSERVAAIAARIGEELRLSPQEVADIHTAGLLHDIGKIGVNDATLQKRSGLTDDEFEHVKQHPLIGYRILRGLRMFHRFLPGVRNHHEDYSGVGYPDRLIGKSIPLLARIIAVADAYDAMRSDRPYRKGLPQSKVDGIFREGAGRQWDPDIVAAYFSAKDDIAAIGAATAWSNEGAPT